MFSINSPSAFQNTLLFLRFVATLFLNQYVVIYRAIFNISLQFYFVLFWANIAGTDRFNVAGNEKLWGV